MKISSCIAILILLIPISSALGRIIGSEIYPSEDELYEAFLIGQIDYQTYLNLRELIDSGIDSTNLYLIEEIPNIDFFQGYDSVKQTDLEVQQTDPYMSNKIESANKKKSGSIRWRRYQKLDRNGRDKNQLNIRAKLSDDWSFKLSGRDEYIGHQEFSFRSLNYKSRRGTIHKMTIGNFTTRFGLGLTVGYRGRLLCKDYLAPEETWLFPDYGGFNGLYLEASPKKNLVKWLFHYDKNDNILIRTSAINFGRKFGLFRVEGTLLGSIVSNRLNKNEFRQYQLGMFFNYSGNHIEAALETTLPKNNLDNSSKNNQSVVAEMTYKRADLSIKFSAWYYGRNFINLFGGGRSGDLYRTIRLELDSINLSYCDRRNNQRGFLIRSSTAISASSEADISLSIYGSSRYERFIEIQSSWRKIFSPKNRLRLYYELFRKERQTEISIDNSLKLEYNYKLPQFSLRSFLGYTYDNDNQKYFSYRFRTKLKNIIFREIEFWVNFSRINIETGNIDYFYGYIREKVDLSKTVSLAIKYRYRYNRSFTESEESTVYLETLIIW